MLPATRHPPPAAAKPGVRKIQYRDLPDGGEIACRTDEPRLATALHEWFDAQLSDDRQDAMAGHDPASAHHAPGALTAELAARTGLMAAQTDGPSSTDVAASGYFVRQH